MTNPSHYPSLENCKKLTVVGFPETELYWDRHTISPISEGFGISSDGEYVCPSVMELLDRLPNEIKDWSLQISKNHCEYTILGDCWRRDNMYTLIRFEDVILPNALAEMWLWLKENKYISYEEQLVKVQEEIGELIKAVKKGEGDIGDEWADCMIAMWILGERLNLSREAEIKKGIEKVNSRIS